MKEALKLALEALENHCGNYKLDDSGCERWNKAVDAIKEALAPTSTQCEVQPEQSSSQEPVAIELALAGLVEKITGGFDSGDLLADAVTASKMLDAQPKQPISVQPEQEPAAWGFRHHDGAIYDCISPEAHADCEGEYTVPLYTTPPKRPWVGLTDRETADCFEAKVISDRLKADAKRIEAKLKEKNCI